MVKADAALAILLIRHQEVERQYRPEKVGLDEEDADEMVPLPDALNVQEAKKAAVDGTHVLRILFSCGRTDSGLSPQ